MRFFLDNDVDAEVVAMLTGRGHQCWRAGQAGLADANDRLIAIYAEERQAVLISHDKAFARKRMANTTGPADLPFAVVERHPAGRCPRSLGRLSILEEVVRRLGWKR